MIRILIACCAMAAQATLTSATVPSIAPGADGAPPAAYGAMEEPLPASLDALFPPKAPGPVLLIRMHALAAPLSGTTVDLMEEDLSNAKSDFQNFRTEYMAIREIVPEWRNRFPVEPVEELGEAMASGTQPRIMAALEKVGQACNDCHTTLMAPVQQKYHWGDFGAIEVSDPLSGDKVGYGPFMHYLDAGLTGVPLDLTQGQVENARKNFRSFSQRFDALSQTCFNCHDTERRYYVDDDVRGMVTKLGETLQAPVPDLKMAASLADGIGMESCFKCHLVHIPAATAQMQMKRMTKVGR